MKNLDEIKIQDRALKREKNVEVMRYEKKRKSMRRMHS